MTDRKRQQLLLQLAQAERDHAYALQRLARHTLGRDAAGVSAWTLQEHSLRERVNRLRDPLAIAPLPPHTPEPEPAPATSPSVESLQAQSLALARDSDPDRAVHLAATLVPDYSTLHWVPDARTPRGLDRDGVYRLLGAHFQHLSLASLDDLEDAELVACSPTGAAWLWLVHGELARRELRPRIPTPILPHLQAAA